MLSSSTLQCAGCRCDEAACVSRGSGLAAWLGCTMDCVQGAAVDAFGVYRCRAVAPAPSPSLLRAVTNCLHTSLMRQVRRRFETSIAIFKLLKEEGKEQRESQTLQLEVQHSLNAGRSASASAAAASEVVQQQGQSALAAEGGNDGPTHQPVVLLLGGGMAAGKSTVRTLLDQSGFWSMVSCTAVVTISALAQAHSSTLRTLLMHEGPSRSTQCSSKFSHSYSCSAVVKSSDVCMCCALTLCRSRQTQ